jgi:DNA-binding NarL/FixJ family response regulator
MNRLSLKNPTGHYYITPREKDVVKLLAQGYSSKMIADELNLSKYSVDDLRKQLLRKTKTANTPSMLISIGMKAEPDRYPFL